MKSEKEELKRLIMIHLDREIMPSRRDVEIICENFSCFYSEDRNSRCLLDEYQNKDGKNYFNIEDMMEICPHFRIEMAAKCKNDGYLVSKEISPQNRVEDLLSKFRKRHEVENIKPNDKSL